MSDEREHAPADGSADETADPTVVTAGGDTHAGRLAAIESAIASQRLPPVNQWQPSREGTLDMRIHRNGDWYYQGSRITRQRMVKLFASVLRCEEDGSIWLVTPHEKLRIEVDAAPFTAVLLERMGTAQEPALVFTTNLGDRVIADAVHRIEVEYPDGENGEPAPYLTVRDRLRALISRSVFLELAEAVEQRDDQLGVRSRGEFMALGRA